MLKQTLRPLLGTKIVKRAMADITRMDGSPPRLFHVDWCLRLVVHEYQIGTREEIVW